MKYQYILLSLSISLLHASSKDEYSLQSSECDTIIIHKKALKCFSLQPYIIIVDNNDIQHHIPLCSQSKTHFDNGIREIHLSKVKLVYEQSPEPKHILITRHNTS